LLERWDRQGYAIAPNNILCSREVLLNALRSCPARTSTACWHRNGLTAIDWNT